MTIGQLLFMILLCIFIPPVGFILVGLYVLGLTARKMKL